MDTKSLVVFFQLLQLGLETVNINENNKIDVDAPSTGICWNNIYELSVKQGVAAFLLDGLQKVTESGVLPAYAISKEVKMKLFSHTMQVEQAWKAHEELIGKLAHFYASHGIKMMLLNGYGLSLVYTRPNHRPCGDIDIWLFGEEQRGDELLRKECGVKIEEDHHHHTVFHIDGIMVENHCDFLDLDTHLSNQELEKELYKQLSEDCEPLLMRGETIYLPPVNFNALFLLRHAAGHFASAEIALRHVTDWGFFVKRYHQEIDWKRLERIAQKQNMLRFLHCLNGICMDYLGFSKELFPEFVRDKNWKRV